MSKRRDTRQEILAVSRRLFVSRGFNGFSFQDLAKELDIRKASIHYHFPTKEDLGVALLNKQGEDVRGWFGRTRGASPSKKLETLFQFYLRIFDAGNGENICLIGMCSAEWNTLGELMRDKLAEDVDQMNAWVIRFLEKGVADGSFDPGLNPLEVARTLFSSLQGALQLARVHGDKSYLETVINQLDAMVRGKKTVPS